MDWRFLACFSLLATASCSEQNGASGTSEPTQSSVDASLPSGAYMMPISVSLTSRLAEGEVRYTTDGTEPSASSPLATSPVSIERTAELRAATFVDGVLSGAPSEYVYVSRSIEASSQLPLMVLDDYGAGSPTKEVELTTALLLIEPSDGTSTLALPASIASRAGIHLRGQTSAEFDQKGYKLELWDSSNTDVDRPLAGLPDESDFVLHNPYVDKSLVRNAFTYGLGPELGLLAPKFAFVELYLNTDNRPLDEDDYQGVYLLVESIKNSKNRLDLAQLREGDTDASQLSGGYILKFELDVAEAPTIPCAASRDSVCWLDLEVADPKLPNPEQLAWIGGHVQEFHDALFSDTFTDPGLGYASFIERESFVNYFILQEFTRNLDAYIRSMYLFKDRDQPLTLGPLWDYNLMGGIGCCGNDPIEGWQYEVARNGDANGWFQRLVQDQSFLTRVSARYRELRQGPLSDAAIDQRIAALTAPLAQAASRHFARWPILTQAEITYFLTSPAPTWEEQVSSLSNWLHRRAAWLDTQW